MAKIGSLLLQFSILHVFGSTENASPLLNCRILHTCIEIFILFYKVHYALPNLSFNFSLLDLNGLKWIYLNPFLHNIPFYPPWKHVFNGIKRKRWKKGLNKLPDFSTKQTSAFKSVLHLEKCSLNSQLLHCLKFDQRSENFECKNLENFSYLLISYIFGSFQENAQG